jgi:LmbE family N-acetylglucosaminyl deacetylase
MTTGPLVVIAPHPDDELLGAAGLLRRAVDEGRAVAVIVATDGGASDPAVASDEMARRRGEETSAGLIALLGKAPPLMFLGCPDGTLDANGVDLGDNSPLRRFLSDLPGASVLVTDPADGHPDHKAAFGLAARIVTNGLADRLDVMPISQRVDGVFDAKGFDVHPLGDLAAVKARAMACHRSQIDSPTGFALPADVLAQFNATEFTRRVHDRNNAATEPVARAHFEHMFERSSDPWSYDSVAYEADRFNRTIATLGGRQFEKALELGCANGALTARLIEHCASLLATDVSQAALDAARARLAGSAKVSFVQGSLPDEVPNGSFDLIILSDMLYYLGLAGVATLMTKVAKRARPDCRIVMTNYLGDTECALTGEMAAEIALAHLPGWHRVFADRTDRLRIDVMERI